MLHCKFSGDCNSERVYKIALGQYLTKLCVQHLWFTFLAHPVYTVEMERKRMQLLKLSVCVLCSGESRCRLKCEVIVG